MRSHGAYRLNSTVAYGRTCPRAARLSMEVTRTCTCARHAHAHVHVHVHVHVCMLSDMHTPLIASPVRSQVAFITAPFEMVRPDVECDQTDEQRLSRGAPNRSRVLDWIRRTPCVRNLLNGSMARGKGRPPPCVLKAERNLRIPAVDMMFPWCDKGCAKRHGVYPPLSEKPASIVDSTD